MRALLLSTLICSVSQAELVLEHVDYHHRQPDGLGRVLLEDLDGDGDRDFLIMGRRNEFVGWMEGFAGEDFSALKRIDTGNFAHAGERPLLLDFDGLGFPDIHYPGWRIPNLFRRYGKAEVYEDTAGCELLAGAGAIGVGWEKTSGEWKIFTASGKSSFETAQGVLRSAEPPGEEQIYMGDLTGEGTDDLVVVLDGAMLGETELRGIYIFKGTGSGFDVAERISTGVPDLLAPVWSSGVRRSIQCLLFPLDKIEDSGANAGKTVSTLFSLHRVGSGWQSNELIADLPLIVAIAPQYSSYVDGLDFSLRTRERETPGGPEYLHRYQNRRIYGNPYRSLTADLLSRERLLEEGSGKIFRVPVVDGDYVCFVPGAGTEEGGADTILRMGPKNRTLYSQWTGVIDGDLIAGPFGELADPKWADLEGDGAASLVGRLARSTAVFVLSEKTGQNPVILRRPLVQGGSHLTAKQMKSVFLNDTDLDGDLDIWDSMGNEAEDGWRVSGPVWENSGEGFHLSFGAWIAFSERDWRVLRREGTGENGWPAYLLDAPGTLGLSKSSLVAIAAYPGKGARVILADHDVDGDGEADLVFFPSVFGNSIAWGKWNGAAGRLEALYPVTAVPEGISIEEFQKGDLDGDGTLEWFHAHLEDSGKLVTWVACKPADGSLVGFVHPPVTFAEPVSEVIATDVDGDGDVDLLRVIDTLPADGSDVAFKEIRWSEFKEGVWLHHDEVLGAFRMLRENPGLAWHRSGYGKDGSRILIANRIGEVLELRTRRREVTAPESDPLIEELAAGTLLVVPGRHSQVEARTILSGSGWKAGLPVMMEEGVIRMRLEISEDLAIWREVDAEPLFIGEEGGRFWYHFTGGDRFPVSGRRFARISFTRP